ncbi:MAG: dihydroorotate dehydrogenase electron transfer subunit [Planctomycetes bacterium]|nr:dihydroorotate dehydrogenase electron transfer subunit [Planctomycetota bacterium]
MTETRDLGGGSFVLRVAGPFEGVQAGQFCMLRTPSDWPVLLPRPFSWFDVFEPGDAALRAGEVTGAATFLGKVVGPGTSRLARLEPGEDLIVTGPLGCAWPAVDAGAREPVCIAGGVGLAPFLLWAKQRRALGARVSILYGGATRHALAASGDFAAIDPDFHFATDDGSCGFHGNVLALYRDLVARGVLDGSAPVYCCGPDPMMEAVAKDCRQRGVRCVVSLETYMACGFGVCNGCTVHVHDRGRFAGRHYVKSCTVGPVFDAEELVWPAEVSHT